MKKIVVIIFTLCAFSHYSLSAMSGDTQVKSLRGTLADARALTEMLSAILSKVRVTSVAENAKTIQRKTSQMAEDCFDNEISRLATGFNDFMDTY